MQAVDNELPAARWEDEKERIEQKLMEQIMEEQRDIMKRVAAENGDDSGSDMELPEELTKFKPNWETEPADTNASGAWGEAVNNSRSHRMPEAFQNVKAALNSELLNQTFSEAGSDFPPGSDGFHFDV